MEWIWNCVVFFWYCLVLFWEWLVVNITELIDCYSDVQACFGPDYSNIFIVFGRLLFNIVYYFTWLIWHGRWEFRAVILFFCLGKAILLLKIRLDRIHLYIVPSLLGYLFTPNPKGNPYFMVEVFLRLWYLLVVQVVVLVVAFLLLEAYSKFPEAKASLSEYFSSGLDFQILPSDYIIKCCLPATPQSQADVEMKRLLTEENLPRPCLPLVPISTIRKYLPRKPVDPLSWRRNNKLVFIKRPSRPLYQEIGIQTDHHDIIKNSNGEAPRPSLSYTTINFESISPRLAAERIESLPPVLQFPDIMSVDIPPLSVIEEPVKPVTSPDLALSPIRANLDIQPEPISFQFSPVVENYYIQPEPLIEEPAILPELKLSSHLASVDISPEAPIEEPAILPELNLSSHLVSMDISPEASTEEPTILASLSFTYQVVASIRPKLPVKKSRKRRASVPSGWSTLRQLYNEPPEQSYIDPQSSRRMFVIETEVTEEEIQPLEETISTPNTNIQTEVESLPAEEEAMVPRGDEIRREESEGDAQIPFTQEVPAVSTAHIVTPDSPVEIDSISSQPYVSPFRSVPKSLTVEESSKLPHLTDSSNKQSTTSLPDSPLNTLPAGISPKIHVRRQSLRVTIPPVSPVNKSLYEALGEISSGDIVTPRQAPRVSKIDRRLQDAIDDILEGKETPAVGGGFPDKDETQHGDNGSTSDTSSSTEAVVDDRNPITIIDPPPLTGAFAGSENLATNQHIAQTRELLKRGRGFAPEGVHRKTDKMTGIRHKPITRDVDMDNGGPSVPQLNVREGNSWRGLDAQGLTDQLATWAQTETSAAITRDENASRLELLEDDVDPSVLMDIDPPSSNISDSLERELSRLALTGDVEMTDVPGAQMAATCTRESTMEDIHADKSQPQESRELGIQPKVTTVREVKMSGTSEDEMEASGAAGETPAETGMSGQEWEDFERDALNMFESLGISDSRPGSGDDAPRWDRRLDEDDTLLANPLLGDQRPDSPVFSEAGDGPAAFGTAAGAGSSDSETSKTDSGSSSDEPLAPRINTEEEIAARVKLIPHLQHDFESAAQEPEDQQHNARQAPETSDVNSEESSELSDIGSEVFRSEEWYNEQSEEQDDETGGDRNDHTHEQEVEFDDGDSAEPKISTEEEIAARHKLIPRLPHGHDYPAQASKDQQHSAGKAKATTDSEGEHSSEWTDVVSDEEDDQGSEKGVASDNEDLAEPRINTEEEIAARPKLIPRLPGLIPESFFAGGQGPVPEGSKEDEDNFPTYSGNKLANLLQEACETQEAAEAAEAAAAAEAMKEAKAAKIAEAKAAVEAVKAAEAAEAAEAAAAAEAKAAEAKEATAHVEPLRMGALILPGGNQTYHGTPQETPHPTPEPKPKVDLQARELERLKKKYAHRIKQPQSPQAPQRPEAEASSPAEAGPSSARKSP